MYTHTHTHTCAFKYWKPVYSLSDKGVKNTERGALASVAQLVRASCYNQKIVGSIPGQGTCLGFVFGPGLGAGGQSPV